MLRSVVGIEIIHDYLTQRGGAERVVLALARGFGHPQIRTSLYFKEGTFPEFSAEDIKTSWMQRIPSAKKHHRLLSPLYPITFRRLKSSGNLAICSTSGWAHAARVTGAKVLYVHNTARWLYQPDDYFRRMPQWVRRGLAVALAPLRRWDKKVAADARLIMVNSRSTQERVAKHWGRSSVVVYPPYGTTTEGRALQAININGPYLLSVCRLLPYKRIDLVLFAAAQVPRITFVIVGSGPEQERLRSIAPANCLFLRDISDQELACLFRGCTGVLVPGVEDLGLVPLEAMAFGKPVLGADSGGTAETVVEGSTGLLYKTNDQNSFLEAVNDLVNRSWDERTIIEHAEQFSEAEFLRRVRDLVLDAVGDSTCGNKTEEGKLNLYQGGE